MSDLERDLQEMLKRREPPRDLTPLIMARLPRVERKPEFRFRQWVPAFSAIAALLVLAVGLFRYDEYRKGQQAKQQLMLALEVTSQKLAMAQEKVNQLKHRRIGNEDQ